MVATNKRATEYVSKDTFVHMNKLIYKALVPTFNEKDATATALVRSVNKTIDGSDMCPVIQEDWKVDSSGGESLGEEAFHNSLFDLADIWTLKVSADEYIEFLEKLLACVSDNGRFRDLDGVQASFCSSFRDISPLSGSLCRCSRSRSRLLLRRRDCQQ